MAAWTGTAALFLCLLPLAFPQTHPVQRHIGRWDAPPAKAPSTMVTDGPLLGNGDMGTVLGGVSHWNVSGSSSCGVGQTYYVGKQDFWTQQAVGDLSGQGAKEVFFQHVAAGHVGLRGGCHEGRHGGGRREVR